MRKIDKHNGLFSKEELPSNWEKEWQGMPEYKMENKEPYQRIVISFYCAEDVKLLSDLIGQKLTPRTNSIWFPKQKNYKPPKNYLYVDES